MPFGVTNKVSTFQKIIDNLIEKYNLKQTYAYSDNVTVTGHNKDDLDKNLEFLLLKVRDLLGMKVSLSIQSQN